MTSLPTTTAYADWLVSVLTQAAAEEHAAAYRARLATADPMAVTVVRHRCTHCGLTRAKKTAAQAHVARCWQNPDVRACKTCTHFEPYEPARGCWGDPQCNCPEVPEGCAVGAWPDGVPFPVIDCPSWQAGP
ncbi:hypothetical protein [Streptomyces scabiei]|uniref:hypothetical protein n=1 Tax=Streptomyces scabiei TaxID=1930 RepID=UPI000765AE9A|nr:hypothetical protein [Streptomyces scabiei]